MSTEHTPGPWQATRSDPAEGYDVWWITASLDGHNSEKEICSVSGKEECNARLVAAAPDLLEAARALMAMIDPDDENTDIWCVDMRAAIAKAEGCAS